MKTKEELTALKEEIETLNQKLAELSEEELTQVAGGVGPNFFLKEILMPGLDDRLGGVNSCPKDALK